MRLKFFVFCLMLTAAFSTVSFAEDIIAKTSNGSVVLLHDDGRWEYFQNNAEIRDVRPSALPKDARFEVTVYYEPVEKLRRMFDLPWKRILQPKKKSRIA